jgi:hypothetical protein
MANLIDITDSILNKNAYCFDNGSVNCDKINIPLSDAKFGILNVIGVTSAETDEELEFLFTVDCSGSMSDICSDNRSKMQHIIHTLKNMILYLHEHKNINAFITINSFDSNFYKIIEHTKITDENFNEINTKIDKISPRSSTNIENALMKVLEEINDIQTAYPNNKISHIFMTDGEATEGSKEIDSLKELINKKIKNSFIGFGIDHDSTLLGALGSVDESSYYFIDKLESAGLIYGEILHSIVYKLLTDVEIFITNGLIYDFKNNNWVENLKIGDIISESNKTFNIISNNVDDFKCQVQGKYGNIIILFPSLMIEEIDLSKHMYRQRTLELMAEVNRFCDMKRSICIDEEYNIEFLVSISENSRSRIDEINDMKNDLKNKLIDLMAEMKKYMAEKNINNDKFMKNLCDDIYVCFRTFDTKYGLMYCNARQTSQGSQRQYTVSNTDAIEETNNLLFRNSTPYPALRRFGRNYGTLRTQYHSTQDYFNPNIHENNEDDDADNIHLEIPILDHQLSNFDETPYNTPQATQVMRFVSNTDTDNCSANTEQIYY